MSLSIALTKGRLEQQTTAMLAKAGYGVEKLQNKACSHRPPYVRDVRSAHVCVAGVLCERFSVAER